MLFSVPAKATIKRKKVQTEEGHSVSIQCQVEGYPPPIVTWKRKADPLPRSSVISNNKTTLQLIGTKHVDTGDYVCKAENSFGASRAEILVEVMKKLSFVYKSNDQYVKPYRNFQVSCLHQGGLGPIRVSWMKNGKKLIQTASLSGNNQVMEIKNVTKTNAGVYSCHVQSEISNISHQIKLNVLPNVFESCRKLRRLGIAQSGYYLINPGEGDEVPVQVYCDMDTKPGEGITVISHDGETRTRVIGIEGIGKYARKVTYRMPMSQVRALKQVSRSCEQHIKYECKGSMLNSGTSSFGWWVSSTGLKMTNWGGVDHLKRGCACSLDGTCPRGQVCMCDANDGIWREDKGYLREKQYLPVTELRFGDTGNTGEEGFHTLGKLRCY